MHCRQLTTASPYTCLENKIASVHNSILKVKLSLTSTSELCHVFSVFFVTGNNYNNFRIDVSTGLLVRGSKALDRETNSSHVLVVEAYNSDQGPMRSSVRVR